MRISITEEQYDSPNIAYLTIPEALDVVYPDIASAFKSSTDDYPKTYAKAMERPDAQQYHDAACQGDARQTRPHNTKEFSILGVSQWDTWVADILIINTRDSPG